MKPAETKLARPPGPTQAPCVQAIIPAYGRPDILARALASLRGNDAILRGVTIVNNSCDDATRDVANASGLPVEILEPRCNLGTAGGIAWALAGWSSGNATTHAWILDDDAVATPGALAAMLDALRETGAEAAAPLLVDETETVRWLPGIVPADARHAGGVGQTPEEFSGRVGGRTIRWRWALWASLLLSRRAVAAAGLPRVDLWSQFSDIEYTLRITEKFRAVLAPRAVCRHLPPPSNPGNAFDSKLRAALQNGNFVATRLPHGRRALRHLPGLHYRYLRHYRWSARSWLGAAKAFLDGAVLGRPSGRSIHSAAATEARAFLDAALRTS